MAKFDQTYSKYFKKYLTSSLNLLFIFSELLL